MNAETEPTINDDEHRSSEKDETGLAGPVTTLQVTIGGLGALALLLGIIAGSATVALTAFGVVALAPLALAAAVRAVGWRGRRIAAREERDEDAALVMPAAALCWQPVVILTDLREQIFHGGTVTLLAGIAAVAFAVLCSRR